MERSALIIRRFDALSLTVRLFSTTATDCVGADLPDAAIRNNSTLGSLAGFGETAEEAVIALWQAVEDLDSNQCVRVERGDELRYYTWNGAAWKEIPAADAGYPARKLGAAQ